MSRVKKVPKPPAALIKKAKKYHVKVTKKVGRKRVYKRVSLIKKQIKKAMRKVRKGRKVRKVRKSRTRYNVEGSGCNKLKKRVCQSSPNCAYTKRGCRRRPGVKDGLVFEGPSLTGFGGRRYSRSHFGLYNPFAGIKSLFVPTWNPPKGYAEYKPSTKKESDDWITRATFPGNYIPEIINTVIKYGNYGELIKEALDYQLKQKAPLSSKFTEADYKQAINFLTDNLVTGYYSSREWNRNKRDWKFLFNSLGYYANRDPKFIKKYRPSGFWEYLKRTYGPAKLNELLN